MNVADKLIPQRHRAVVNTFATAIADHCKGLGIKEMVAEVVADSKGRDLIVFTLHDAFGEGSAPVTCAPDESPRTVARRAHREFAAMIHTGGA